MTPAPPRVSEVASPSSFNASALATLEACPLSGLVRGVRLPRAGVWAEVGTWLHGYAEVAAHARLETWAEAEALLDATLAHQGASRARPPEGLTPWAWREACARAVRYALGAGGDVVGSGELERRGGAEAVVAKAGGSGRGRAPCLLKQDETYVEAWLEDEGLRVQGRVDRVTRRGAQVEVVDFKTGRALDADGRPKRAAWLQLLAYGAVVQRLVPEAEVTLVVEAAVRTAWPFDAACAAEVAGVLDALDALVPRGSTVSAERLARPGEACARCSARLACPAYPRALDAWTRDGAAHPFADDALGRVVGVVPEVSGLDLETAEGVRLRLRNVPEPVRAEATAGRWLETYGEGQARWVKGRCVLPRTLDGARRTYFAGDTVGSA